MQDREDWSTLKHIQQRTVGTVERGCLCTPILHRRWFTPVRFFRVTAAPMSPCTTASPVDCTCLAVSAMFIISWIRLLRNAHVSWKSGEESCSITSSVVL
uniref:Uncharacterized protein n=1 Tax=Anguilla anguilla TaxID=7936 RepID=A0A0E9WHB7_ANGAN